MTEIDQSPEVMLEHCFKQCPPNANNKLCTSQLTQTKLQQNEFRYQARLQIKELESFAT